MKIKIKLKMIMKKRILIIKIKIILVIITLIKIINNKNIKNVPNNIKKDINSSSNSSLSSNQTGKFKFKRDITSTDNNNKKYIFLKWMIIKMLIKKFF